MFKFRALSQSWTVCCVWRKMYRCSCWEWCVCFSLMATKIWRFGWLGEEVLKVCVSIHKILPFVGLKCSKSQLWFRHGFDWWLGRDYKSSLLFTSICLFGWFGLLYLGLGGNGPVMMLIVANHKFWLSFSGSSPIVWEFGLCLLIVGIRKVDFDSFILLSKWKRMVLSVVSHYRDDFTTRKHKFNEEKNPCKSTSLLRGKYLEKEKHRYFLVTLRQNSFVVKTM